MPQSQRSVQSFDYDLNKVSPTVRREPALIGPAEPYDEDLPREVIEATALVRKNSRLSKKEDLQVVPIGRGESLHLQLIFSPKDYIEYTIALKSVTELCSDFEYFQIQTRSYIQTNTNEQHEVVTNGIAFKRKEKASVCLTIKTDPDNGTLLICFYGDKEQCSTYIEKFRNLCSNVNFYRGKNLKALHLRHECPLIFLPEPEELPIFGFKKEQTSLLLHGVEYFDFHDLHKLASQRGILLHGRPGSGKSLLVSKIKRECLRKGITVLDITSRGMECLMDWYNVVEKWLAPALVVLEDIDLIALNRESMEASPVSNDLLNSLGGNCRRDGVIITLATTNRVACLDSAVLRSRRMDKIYKIDGLSHDFKLELFKRHGLDLDASQIKNIQQNLGENTTGADVEEISISTLTYQKKGYPFPEAFELSFQEWMASHATKTSVGFNA